MHGSRAQCALGRDTRVCLRQTKAGCTIEQLKKTLGRTSCPTTTTGAVRPAMSRAAICSSKWASPVPPLQSPPPRLVSSLQPRSPRPPQSQRRPRPRRGRQLQYPRHRSQRHGSRRWKHSPPPKPTRSRPSSRGSSPPTRTAPAPPRRARRITSTARSPGRCAPRAPAMPPTLPPSTSMRRRRKARRSPSSRHRIRIPCSPTWRRTSPPASPPTPPRSSPWCAPTPSRARSAIPTTAATPTSSAGT